MKLAPKVPGSYTIEIMLTAVKLAASPFMVLVQERGFSVVLVRELNMSREGRVERPRGVAAKSKSQIAVTD